MFLIPRRKPVFALSTQYQVLSREADHTNFTSFGLIQAELDPTIYHTSDNHANYDIADEITQSNIL
jgi:hypothetical protein